MQRVGCKKHVHRWHLSRGWPPHRGRFPPQVQPGELRPLQQSVFQTPALWSCFPEAPVPLKPAPSCPVPLVAWKPGVPVVFLGAMILSPGPTCPNSPSQAPSQALSISEAKFKNLEAKFLNTVCQGSRIKMNSTPFLPPFLQDKAEGDQWC